MRTSGEELSDLFNALQIRTKVMIELIESRKIGTRPEDDFKSRFWIQAHTLAFELKKIKPLVDSLLVEGNALSSSVSSDSEKQVLTFKC